MFGGSLVLGFTLLGFAGWLHWNETQGWPDDSHETELDRKYHDKRFRARRRIHMIIGLCGVLVVAAAFAGPGPIWLGAWMSVFLALLTVVVLAGFDAFRTHRYHRDKFPEIRSRLDED